MLLLLQPFQSRLRIFEAESDIVQGGTHPHLLQEPHHVLEHGAGSEIDAPEDAKPPQSAHHIWDLLPSARSSEHTGESDEAVEPDGIQGLGHRRGADHVDDVVDAASLRR